MYGNQNKMAVIFDQVYYSAKADLQKGITISGAESSDKKFAGISDVDYGRRVIVFLTISTKTSLNPEEEWKASITNTGFKDTNILKDTGITVFSVGGSVNEFTPIFFDDFSIKALNDYIASELDYSKDRIAIPLSYKMNYIEDGSQVYANQKIENSDLKVEKRETIKVNFDSAYNYITNYARFYARPILGVNKDGSYKLGNWECLHESGSNNQEFYVSGKYAEFAFSFDIMGGKDWPYTDIFWRANQGAPKKIYIEWGGGSLTPWIEITVDGNRVVDQSGLSSHDKDKFQ